MANREWLRLGVAAYWHRPNFILWRKMVTAALAGQSSCPDLDLVSGPLPALGSGCHPKHGWKLLVPIVEQRASLEALSSEAFLEKIAPMIKDLPQHLQDALPALPAEGSSIYQQWVGGFPSEPCTDERQPLAPSAGIRQPLVPSTKMTEGMHMELIQLCLDLRK